MISQRHPFSTVLGAILLVIALGVSRAESAPELPVNFRVMTWNIHHGEGIDGRVDLGRIASLILSEEADVVALQEVDKGIPRSGQKNLAAELASLTRMNVVFANNYAFAGGEYGNALLSRFPILQWTNTHYQMLSDVEPRGILQAVLDIHGRKIIVANTHLDAQRDDAERLNEVGQIPAILRPYPYLPLILCGDFNAIPDSPVYRTLTHHFTDAWIKAGSGSGATIPVNAPSRRIDYLWLDKDSSVPLKALRLWVPISQASDHLPVVGIFHWGAQP